MRLINVKTHRLEEFHHDIPPYAILSHTWGDEEISFQEYQEYFHGTSRCLCPGSNASSSNIEIKAGFAKIMGACKRAREDNLGHLWCDTNCIDKSSSAELAEAINSMYAWYRDSAVCYAYLTNVGVSDRVGMVTRELRKSRWFTRGWTLQELLAPKELLFFNKEWGLIDNRQRLANVICGITRIHKGALENRDTIPTYSVAQRMSWAADRRTSRQEDIAYCLLGLFGINMPLLYGEGLKAFTRLQEEIIQLSNDQSIFAWDFLASQHRPYTGMLAPSPDEFSSCGSIIRDDNFTQRPYATTNIGVSLELLMIETYIRHTVMVELNCSVELRAYGPRRDAQGPNHIGWRFPVWIWLRSVDKKIYTRSPSPVSRTSLLNSYTNWFDRSPSELFGIINTSKASSVHPLIHKNSTASTGFHMTISFGRIKSQFGTFDQVFTPADFTTHRIPPRGSPALSHEIISAGKYAALLSIVWDHQNQQPRYWYHSSFMSLTESTIREMSESDWNLFFETPDGSTYGNSHDAERVGYIHDQVRKLSVLPTTSIEKDAMPFVCMEKTLWQDHHGHAKVVAHVTFQEETRLQKATRSQHTSQFTRTPCIIT